MLAVRRILCPTDFSDASRRALELAVPLARQFGAEIYLLHVVPTVPRLEPSPTYHFDVPEYERHLREEARRQLETFGETVDGVRVHKLLADGDAAEGILRAVEEHRIDWIVIATAGRTGLGRAVFGSVAEKVVRRATCPVLVIRQH